MNYVDEAAEFRKFLQDKGHNLWSGAEMTMYLDLNQGPMKIDATSRVGLLGFVADMKEFFGDRKYSEMDAINQLVAERDKVAPLYDRSYWHRPYHVDYSINPKKWITFEQYIKEIGW